MLNNLIKQERNNIIVIGIQQDRLDVNKWNNFIHNYSLSKKLYIVHDSFAYFLTDRESLESGLTLYFEHQSFLRKELTGDEIASGSGRFLRRQETRRFLRSMPSERFLYKYNSSSNEEYAIGQYQDSSE